MLVKMLVVIVGSDSLNKIPSIYWLQMGNVLEKAAKII